MKKYDTDGLIASACVSIDMMFGNHPVEDTVRYASCASAYALVAIAEELAKVRKIIEADNVGDGE